MSRALVALLATVGVLAVAPAVAQAGAGLAATPTFPMAVDVGQTGVLASLTLINTNTPPDGAATICRHDDLPFPGPLDQCFGGDGIVVTPSCGAQFPISLCRPTGADPDVLRINSPALGAASTACDGIMFTVVPVGDALGRYRFDPPAGTHVRLPNIGDRCIINFSFDVLRLPNIDIRPMIPGLQTAQIVEASEHSDNGNLGAGQGTTTPMTVNPNCQPSAPGTCNRFAAGQVTMATEAPATGCRAKPFRVVVHGTFIDSVVFRVDGKRITTRTRPNYRRDRFSVTIRPSGLKAGRHRITTQTRFAAQTQTKPKTLQRTFQACA